MALGAFAVADRFDVGGVVGVGRRGDRDALGEVAAVAHFPTAPQSGSLLVRVSMPRRSDRCGSGALVLHPVQELLGAPSAGGNDDVVGCQNTRLLTTSRRPRSTPRSAHGPQGR